MAGRMVKVAMRKDREAAKQYFIMGEPDPATGYLRKPTLKETAVKYGFNYGHIRKVANKEDWKSLQQEYHDEMRDETAQKARDMEIDSLAQINATRYRIAAEYCRQFEAELEAKKVHISASMALAFFREMKEIGEKVHGIDSEDNEFKIVIEGWDGE